MTHWDDWEQTLLTTTIFGISKATCLLWQASEIMSLQQSKGKQFLCILPSFSISDQLNSWWNNKLNQSPVQVIRTAKLSHFNTHRHAHSAPSLYLKACDSGFNLLLKGFESWRIPRRKKVEGRKKSQLPASWDNSTFWSGLARQHCQHRMKAGWQHKAMNTHLCSVSQIQLW